MALSSRTIGVLAAVATVALWSSFIIVGRASAALDLLPLDLLFVRIVGAGAVLLPVGLWLTRRGGPARESRSLLGLSPLPLRQTVLTGFFGGVTNSALSYSAFFFAPAAHASVLMPGSQPLWTALLAVVILGEALTRARVLSLACIAGGAALVGGPSLLAALDGAKVWIGDLFFILAGMCWAMYTVLAQRFRLDALHSTVAIVAFACCSYVPLFMLLVGTGLLPTHLGMASWREIVVQALFQGVGVVAVAGITFVTMVRTLGPVRAATIGALVPGLSALGAVALLGEPLGWNLVTGLALVTAGILLGVLTLGGRGQAKGAGQGVAP